MKKIVLLSLALFSVAALRAEGPADWAQYGRYELQNAVLDRPVEVVFMGNSITDGWIRVDPDFFERNGFLDRGISGQTTVQMLARFRSDVIDLKPQVVVILAGINDIARNNGPIKLENVFGNIVSMCDLARYNGIKVVLCSLLPASRGGPKWILPRRSDDSIRCWNAMPRSRRFPMWITIGRSTTAAAECPKSSPKTAAIRFFPAICGWSRWSSKASTGRSAFRKHGIQPYCLQNNR